jgi:hypothetical protein
MDDIVERMRALLEQEERDEADAERSRALRPRHPWLGWLRRTLVSAGR